MSNFKKEALLIAEAAEEKKAKDIIVLDMRKLSDLFSYFVICSGSSSRQIKAIADNITEKATKSGIRLWHIEGYSQAIWTLLDFGEVIVHVFYEQRRRFYNLELLWSEAPQIKI